MPIKKIRPDHLVEDIGRVLEKRNEWVDWGIASRMYVERWHNPETLSRALIVGVEEVGRVALCAKSRVDTCETIA